jgi:hypothetical protein
MSRNYWFIQARKTGGEWFELQCPEGRYYADPFLAKKDGKYYLYFEDYDYQKGKLSFCEITDFKIGEKKTALELDVHCSFPSVIEFDGKYYMTPETVLAGELSIYEGWGEHWEKICEVARGRFDDPILFRRQNTYYIYTNEGGTMTVFSAPAITGPWSKIKAEDKPIHRSAGHIYFNGQRYLRPLQDCRELYGKSISVVELDSGIEQFTLLPDWKDGLIGTHTLNFLDEYEVVDGKIVKN